MVRLENKKVILGSSSPRRRELLELLGVDFEIIKPCCDETLDLSLPIKESIIDVSKRKALSIKSNEIVITADTLVVLGDNILGKPKDFDDAFSMLRLLSDNTHNVLTAVSIKNNNEITSFCQTTKVTFHKLSHEEIASYINSGESFDKAGSYGIQGLGSVLVKEIHGDYFNVVGLPISTLYQHLKNI